MKFTFEDKVQIYKERKRGFTLSQLHFKWNIAQSKIEYIVRLVDRHGIDILRHIHHDYSAEFKEEAIYRVLTLHESILSVSIDLGLSTNSILRRWIKEYKENGYNVVIRKRGRHAKETIEELEKEIKFLREQNLRLLIENEFIKKLDALVTEREAREKKK